MIASITKARAGGVTVRFGSNAVRRYTEEFPCRVWRVVESGDREHYTEIRTVTLAVRADRRIDVREAAAREANKGWQAGATKQWAEVRPVEWKPPVIPKVVLRKRLRDAP